MFNRKAYMKEYDKKYRKEHPEQKNRKDRKQYMKKYTTQYWQSKPQTERKKIAQTTNERKAQQRQENKRKAVKLKGGKCIKCGYNRCIQALGFHHRDPSTKDRSTYKMKETLWARPWEFILKEIEKCDLLCANCHMEEHYLNL